MRAAVGRVDSSVPVTGVRTMADVLDASLAQASFAMTLLIVAAVIALVLGVVGLYGVISYVVAQRTTEIGIRLALGADPRDMRVMVVRQGVTVAAIGVIVGLAAAAGTSQLMASLLFDVSAHDPATFGIVAGLLLVVSAGAAYLPARAAAAVEPLQALRQT
jgi:ABC-type antimicrobial peptide transport system permease subunit